MIRSNTQSADDAGQTTNEPTGEHFRAGLSLLGQAYTYAQDAGVDLWDFALEIDKLYEAGMTISDLRWLVAKRLAEHGEETSLYGAAHRSFRHSDGLNFADATCLFLTPNGATFAGNILQESAASMPSTLSIATASIDEGETAVPSSDRLAADEMDGPPALLKPHWDPARRELWLDDTIVKRFQVPARNQQAILCAFEEEDWPEHIDDPLPVSGDIDPRTRLHDAIYRLNHRQTNDLLRFHGNGSADGVLWERL